MHFYINLFMPYWFTIKLQLFKAIAVTKKVREKLWLFLIIWIGHTLKFASFLYPKWCKFHFKYKLQIDVSNSYTKCLLESAWLDQDIIQKKNSDVWSFSCRKFVQLRTFKHPLKGQILFVLFFFNSSICEVN